MSGIGCHKFRWCLKHGLKVLWSVGGLDDFTPAASGLCPTDGPDNTTCLSPNIALCSLVGSLRYCSCIMPNMTFWHCKRVNSPTLDPWIIHHSTVKTGIVKIDNHAFLALRTNLFIAHTLTWKKYCFSLTDPWTLSYFLQRLFMFFHFYSFQIWKTKTHMHLIAFFV